MSRLYFVLGSFSFVYKWSWLCLMVHISDIVQCSWSCSADIPAIACWSCESEVHFDLPIPNKRNAEIQIPQLGTARRRSSTAKGSDVVNTVWGMYFVSFIHFASQQNKIRVNGWLRVLTVYMQSGGRDSWVVTSLDSRFKDPGLETTFRPVPKCKERISQLSAIPAEKAKGITWCGHIERKDQGRTARLVYLFSGLFALCT